MTGGKEGEVKSASELAAEGGDDQESIAELVLFQVKECYVYMV